MSKVDEKATTLTALIERVEAGSGPDRELDFWLLFAVQPELARHATGFEKEPAGVLPIADGFAFLDGAGKRYGCWGGHVVPRYSAGVDAAVALIEAKLPQGTGWRIHSVPTFNPLRATALVTPPGLERYNGEATTPARALLAATLRALQKGQTDAG